MSSISTIIVVTLFISALRPFLPGTTITLETGNLFQFIFMVEKLIAS